MAEFDGNPFPTPVTVVEKLGYIRGNQSVQEAKHLVLARLAWEATLAVFTPDLLERIEVMTLPVAHVFGRVEPSCTMKVNASVTLDANGRLMEDGQDAIDKLAAALRGHIEEKLNQGLLYAVYIPIILEELADLTVPLNRPDHPRLFGLITRGAYRVPEARYDEARERITDALAATGIPRRYLEFPSDAE